MIVKAFLVASLAGSLLIAAHRVSPTPTSTNIVAADATIATTPRERWCVQKTGDVADCKAAYGDAP